LAVPIEKLGICYFPVPKVANTSIKHMLFEIENGKPFRSPVIIDGVRKSHIHRVYETVPFEKGNLASFNDMLRIAVIRDPLERLVSCWRNRVQHYGELSSGKVSLNRLEELGVPPDPDLNTFALNIGKYRKAKGSIHTHAAPIVDFLGHDANYFHMIFSINNLPLVEDFFHILTGEKRKLRRSQTGGPKASIAELSETAIQHLKQVYAADYEVFGQYFNGTGAAVEKPLKVMVADG
jgi:Sulfotransferase family